MRIIKSKQLIRGISIYGEIVLLILASFSPLLDRPQKALLVLVLFLYNIKYAKRATKDKWVILGAFLMIFMISFALDLRNVSSLIQVNILNLYFPLCVMLGFLISQKYQVDEYLYFIEKIVFVSALFSLVSVFLYTFLPDIAMSLPKYTNEHTIRRTALLFNIMTSNDGSYLVHRNMGIAWEPGAFQILLNIGLYSYLRLNNKTSLLRIVIYFMAIFFTKSTAGLLIFMLITFNILKNDKRGRILILISFIAFGIPIFNEILYHINNKLLGSASFSIRFDPLKDAFINGSPHIFGLGNSGFDINYRPYNKLPYDSLGQIFLRYGYFMLLLVGTRLLRLLKGYKILFFILIISFSAQNIWYLPFLTPFYFVSINKAVSR